MLINQEAQAKAQKEIDEVTGRNRLPRMSDRNSMPYLSAVVWETFRWAPPVPVSKYKRQYSLQLLIIALQPCRTEPDLPTRLMDIQLLKTMSYVFLTTHSSHTLTDEPDS